jgi:hypothetical protein
MNSLHVIMLEGQSSMSFRHYVLVRQHEELGRPTGNASYSNCFFRYEERIRLKRCFGENEAACLVRNSAGSLSALMFMDRSGQIHPFL